MQPPGAPLEGIKGMSQPESWAVEESDVKIQQYVSREGTAEYSLNSALVYHSSTAKSLSFRIKEYLFTFSLALYKIWSWLVGGIEYNLWSSNSCSFLVDHFSDLTILMLMQFIHNTVK